MTKKRTKPKIKRLTSFMETTKIPFLGFSPQKRSGKRKKV